MSYFDDAMSDWIDGGCRGIVEDYLEDPTLALFDDDDDFDEDDDDE